MDQHIYNKLVSFIWAIASDCLVDIYDVGDYRKIILPFMVIRRFDAVLEPTKDKVLAMKENLEGQGMTNIAPALCKVAGEAFCNSSPYTLTDLRSRTNQQQLKADFNLYLDGFSDNVQDIINRFEFRQQVEKLSSNDVLGLLIKRFTSPEINLSSRPVLNDDGSERLPALDNHTMGTAFEEVIRRFNEETNVTDAGRHFTPRDVVRLMAELAFVPVQDKIKSSTYRIYDGACGTGGMLTVGEERIKELAEQTGEKVSVHLYGQENFDETYAIAKADMLLKGEDVKTSHIRFGSTISDDKFPTETFDFALSNPPFGTPWKKDMVAWGYKKKEEITDLRFVKQYQGEEFRLVPDIGDPQMLFLANNISKMKKDTELGSRIVEVHNGSSLFNGKAGSGNSNLRRYIIEQDMLEAIVAIPENMFYNTGIGTFLWIVTNRKSEERRGKVQLIDATSMKKPLRKNIGQKNCEISRSLREKIMELYLAFDKADPKYSKVFLNEEFGYYSVDVARPLRLHVRLGEEDIASLKRADASLATLVEQCISQKYHQGGSDDFTGFLECLKGIAQEKGIRFTKKMETLLRVHLTEVSETAQPVIAKHSKGEAAPLYGRYQAEKGCMEYEADSNLKETEQVPLTYPGGLEAFMEQEVRPYAPDGWLVEKSITIGYELSFTKYFYEPVKLRSLSEIDADILATKQEMSGLLDEIVGAD
ncbi:MAG: class I SAM-dependent DNA methyltransferase [Selenomonadaceae bacterium]|nr:class I SAM-dependent DNA methyltransferase [Selenomonadaceae bacterium]